MATRSSILAWRIPWPEEPGGYSSQGHKESHTIEATENAHTLMKAIKPYLAVEVCH